LKAIIKDSKKTKIVDLSHGSLTEIPEEVLKLHHLEKLILTNNKLTAIPESIGQFTSLKVLDVSNNQITSIPSEISECDQLEVLDASSNHLDSLPTSLHRLRNLTSVSLTGNPDLDIPEDAENNVQILTKYLSSLEEEDEEAEELKEQEKQDDHEKNVSDRVIANKQKKWERAKKDKFNTQNKQEAYARKYHKSGDSDE